MEAQVDENILLHIVLVGFNHRKGGEVEFIFPSIKNNENNENSDEDNLPGPWKFLSSLSLPDGSHNYENDTVFFVLPSINGDRKSVFGISCFRQIPVESLKNRTSDLTRSSVQKAVCVLLSYPIYGHIEVKLSLIAQSFFDQRDFSKRELLRDAYEYLKNSLIDFPLNTDEKYLTPPSGSQISPIHVGLSLRELMLKWKYKILTLFKLLLLERRVIFFGSPVRPICSLILAINSLHPLLIETGFNEVAFIKSTRTSPIPQIRIFESENEPDPDNENEESVNESTNVEMTKTESSTELDKTDESPETKIENDELIMEATDKTQTLKETTVDSFANNMNSICSINPSSFLGPLPLYKNGYLCLPFISLSYMDLITDISVYAYVIGASNVLFRQKRNLADVLVDVQNVSIETGDEGLKRILQPSTEDLRFIDYVIKNVQNPKENGDGNENWIRRQFYGYFVGMLRTSYEINVSGSARNLEHFNSLYMQTWQKTNHYQEWLAKMITATAQNSNQIKPFIQLQPGHPFSGTSLTVQDMKIRIAQTMQNSESGRRINQAYSSAKSTLSTWFSSLSTSELDKEKSIKIDDKIEVTASKCNKKDNLDEIGVEVTEKLV